MSDRILVMSQGEIVARIRARRVRRAKNPRRRVPRAGGRGMNRDRARPGHRLPAADTRRRSSSSSSSSISALQRRELLQRRERAQHRQAGVVHRRHRRRHDLRAADRRHRPLGRLEHVCLGHDGRLPAAASRVAGRLRRLRRHRRRARDRRAFGAINAFCIVVLRITPFLVTLATLVAGHGLVTAITESFGIDYPAGLHRLRRGVGPRRADADRRLRAGRRGGARRAHPHAVRPAALRRRQRPRGGAQGRHQHRPHRLLPSTSSAASAPRSAA